MTTATADWTTRLAGLRPPAGLHIDGRSVAAATGRTFPCISPRDGRVVAEVAEGGAEDVDRAVASARSAFQDGRWARRSPRERRETLLRLADLIEEHREELALLESVDMGKPISDSLAVDLRVTLQTFRFYAEAIDKLYGEVAPTAEDQLATITREPVGVVGAVVPWNFPLMMAAWKLAPALAVGNSVVLKPAEQSPLTALRLAELAAEAGLPPGVLNVVPGFGPTAGAALGRHPDVDALGFTGSGEVGRAFLIYAGESNMKKVMLECGGKSPQIVLPDAPDLDRVADAIVSGIYFNQGEACSAGSRLLVHDDIKDQVLERVVERSEQWHPGDPLDPSTRIGAVVEQRHLQRVLEYVAVGQAEGASLITGGRRAREETGGFYVEPTVFDAVRPEMRIAQEEIFGPVLSVLTFRTLEEAIDIANATSYGLAAAVWTTDVSAAHRTARDLRAGTVWINCFDASDITVPFGGSGESGYGRDKSLHAVDNYTHRKTTWLHIGA
ncbi:aldehyde dehydrogenase [Nitriliruptor alkaliphilus]|uniref:aldehyde dehydrogenase n=1 Tax=Nitriliruptor alkaliphilus TaxID=427918 RepID=UPI0006969842|nr:aldehyde dehydrogenase [Nitriliruptor alkaliphilus]